MISVALSLLFGAVAFVALAQILFSIRRGTARARLIRAELARIDSAAQTVVRFSVRRPVVASWRPRLVAA